MAGPQRKQELLRRGIRRVGSKESGFRYETATGAPLTDEKALDRIAALKVPPAWREVRIATTPRAPLQAIGLDSKGRTQYRYHPSFRQKREDEKYLRVVGFGEVLPRLRARVRADLAREGLGRERVLAAIVRLIDQGFFRVGNDKSAKSEATFGLTTVRGDHVTVRGSTVEFKFVGKWKKTHGKKLADPQVAAVVRALKARDGAGELFRWYEDGRVVDVKDRHVNEYIQSIIGPRFTAKDFRTWAGTLLTSLILGREGQAETRKARKKKMKKAIETTAMLLGNTPAVSRSSYICPRLLHDYEEGLSFERMARIASPIPKSGRSSKAEKALLQFLRETIADRRRRRRASSARYHGGVDR